LIADVSCGKSTGLARWRSKPAAVAARTSLEKVAIRIRKTRDAMGYAIRH
jgi:hypothetical protein